MRAANHVPDRLPPLPPPTSRVEVTKSAAAHLSHQLDGLLLVLANEDCDAVGNTVRAAPCWGTECLGRLAQATATAQC